MSERGTRLTERMRATVADAIAALRAARHRSDRTSFIGELGLYCAHADCIARDITIRIKELEGPADPLILVCPLCLAPLKTHWVKTAEEVERDADAEARMSVNAQLWSRAHPDALAIPADVFCDDRLPEIP